MRGLSLVYGLPRSNSYNFGIILSLWLRSSLPHSLSSMGSRRDGPLQLQGTTLRFDEIASLNSLCGFIRLG